MNSLSYLSRQFDVLASPRAPPSTPVEETGAFSLNHGSLSDHRETTDVPLKRASTWSTKSWLFPPAMGQQPKSPKRSFSSPAGGFLTIARNSLRTIDGVVPLPTDTPIRMKSYLESTIREVWFVKVVTLLWDAACAVFASIRRDVLRIQRGIHEPLALTAGSVDEKDADSESDEERVVIRESKQPLQPPSPVVTSAQVTPSTNSTSGTLLEVSSASEKVSSPVVTTLPPSPADVTRKPAFTQKKTLVLDLDETLIHSTSRPIYASSGGGLLGFGGSSKGPGLTVEVFIGGRSTVYHVYKRPFVDYFLKKVSARWTTMLYQGLTLVIGVKLVHSCNFYRVYARICGSRYRLAGCRSRNVDTAILSRGKLLVQIFIACLLISYRSSVL